MDTPVLELIEVLKQHVLSPARRPAGRGKTRPVTGATLKRLNELVACVEAGGAGRPAGEGEPPGAARGVTAPRTRPPGGVPRWDKSQGEFWWGGRLLKRYGRAAPVQWFILDAFEAAGWPGRVAIPAQADGVCPEPERLPATVYHMNQVFSAFGLRFSMDGTGTGVRWSAARPGATKCDAGAMKSDEKRRKATKKI